MPPTLATFQLNCETPMLVSEARELLTAIQHAYDGLEAFTTTAQELVDRANSWEPWASYFPLPPAAREGLYGSPFPLHDIPAAQLVPADEVLILRSAQLQSPGFFEFLGGLNPLEVLRRYLNDRHQRKLDLMREPERQRHDRLENDNLELRNERLAIENFREQLTIQREFGISTSEITQLYRRYVPESLRALGDVTERVNATASEVKALPAR